MLITQGQDEIKAAFAIQSRATLKHIRLNECHLSMPKAEDSFTPPLSLRLVEPHTAASFKQNQLVVSAIFRVESWDSSKPKAEQLFSIDCGFDVAYELEANYTPSDTEINAFKNGNAIFNAWPYVREFVHGLTSRMGSEAPPLPLLRIAPKPPADAKQSDKPQLISAQAEISTKRRRRNKA